MYSSSSNVFLTEHQCRSALRISSCLASHKNNLDEFADCMGFVLVRDPALQPNQGLHFRINGQEYIAVGKSDARNEMLTCLHEIFHLLHSPACLIPELQHVQIVREEARANAFAGLAFMPRMRRYEEQQSVYNVFGEHHADVAYARIVHESRHPSWV